jgi:hypothetical protein
MVKKDEFDLLSIFDKGKSEDQKLANKVEGLFESMFFKYEE